MADSNSSSNSTKNPLPILGPAKPVREPKDHKNFWSSNRRGIDRIGWTGKYILSDSEDSEEDESDEDEEEGDKDTVTLTDQQRDDYYHTVISNNFWTEVYWAGDSNSGSERDISDTDTLEASSDTEGWQDIVKDAFFAEPTAAECISVVAFILFGQLVMLFLKLFMR